MITPKELTQPAVRAFVTALVDQDAAAFRDAVAPGFTFSSGKDSGGADAFQSAHRTVVLHEQSADGLTVTGIAARKGENVNVRASGESPAWASRAKAVSFGLRENLVSRLGKGRRRVYSCRRRGDSAGWAAMTASRGRRGRSREGLRPSGRVHAGSPSPSLPTPPSGARAR